MRKFVGIMVFLMVVSACAGQTSTPTPVPQECTGAKIAYTQEGNIGKAAVKTAWIALMIGKPDLKPVMGAMALAAKVVVSGDGSISAMVEAMAQAARNMGAGDWALLATPIADILVPYNDLGTNILHSCDRKFLFDLFTELAVYSGMSGQELKAMNAKMMK